MYRPRVFKQKGSRVYRGRYRLSGEFRIHDVPLDTPYKHVAQAKLDRLVRELEEERAGLIAPRAIREAVRKPLAEHLAEFIAELESRGRTETHIWQTRTRLTRLFAECGWKTIPDITANSFVSWRAGRSDLSPKTCNAFLAHAKSLLLWLERHARIAHNPLRPVLNADVRGQQSFARRALSVAEVERLAAQDPRRGLAYRAAAYTGLRRSELTRLLWADCHLEVEKPYIELRAATAKNRKGAIIPLVPPLAAALRATRPKGFLANRPVFRRGLPAVATMRTDLAAAGIPFEDERGFRADFHALRHTFASLLAQAGVSELMRVKLARHSDWRQTDRYTDPSSLPLFAEMEKLGGIIGSSTTSSDES